MTNKYVVPSTTAGSLNKIFWTDEYLDFMRYRSVTVEHFSIVALQPDAEQNECEAYRLFVMHLHELHYAGCAPSCRPCVEQVRYDTQCSSH